MVDTLVRSSLASAAPSVAREDTLADALGDPLSDPLTGGGDALDALIADCDAAKVQTLRLRDAVTDWGTPAAPMSRDFWKDLQAARAFADEWGHGRYEGKTRALADRLPTVKDIKRQYKGDERRKMLAKRDHAERAVQGVINNLRMLDGALSPHKHITKGPPDPYSNEGH